MVQADRRDAFGERFDQGLAFVHALDDAQLGHSGVPHLALEQPARDDADHAPAGRQSAVGHRAHQAHLAAAVDELDALAGQHLAQAPGDLHVVIALAARSTAIHRHAFHTRLAFLRQGSGTGALY